MKMKLNALSLAVVAGFIGSAAQAADVAMFPYVVNSPTVTTIVSIVDRGTAATPRYDASGVAGVAVNQTRLHWRLNYKADANATVNLASCAEVDYYLPSSPNDIQTVDLGGKFGSTTKGVLFSDNSVNNNWNAGTTSSINYMLGKAAGATQRGVLFVHNADASTNDTIFGEAMVLEFASGAAWGYQAVGTNATANDNSGFQFSGTGNVVVAGRTATVGAPTGLLTFMPPAETTTRLFVMPTPFTGTAANDALATPVTHFGAATTVGLSNPMLGVDGASATGWNIYETNVTMATGTGVAYDRDENLVSGSVATPVRCVGAVSATELMTSGAASVLANGGWGNISLRVPNLAVGSTFITANGGAATNSGYITKLEFNSAGKLNNEALTGTFNNAFIMR